MADAIYEAIKNLGINKVIEKMNEESEYVRQSIKSDAEKPKFYCELDYCKDFNSLEFVLEIEEQRKQLKRYNLDVQILEDIEMFDAGEGNRFAIRITYYDKYFITIDLHEYRNNLLAHDFDAVKYFEKILSRLIGGLTVNAEDAARCITEYLANIMYCDSAYLRIYSDIGWDYLYNKLIFKYDEIQSFKMNEYDSYLPLKGECIDNRVDSLKPMGDTYEWLNQLVELLNHSAINCLLVGASVSGVIRQLLPFTKETNININIVGQKASGKSTLCHFLLSTFGNPEKLEGSFTDTTNKMEEIRAGRPILPYVLDERMLRFEDESEKNRRKNIIMDIFREYEGKVKERMGSRFEKLSGARSYGPVISSSVKSIMDEIYDYVDIGQFRRFIEINIKPKDLFANKEMAERTEQTASTSYGHGIGLLVSRIFNANIFINGRVEEVAQESVETWIKDRFDEVNAYITERLENESTNIKAFTQRFALIVLSYDLMLEAIELYCSEEGGKYDIKNKRDEIIDILIKNAIKKVEKVDAFQVYKSDLVNYIAKNKNAFCFNSDGWDDTQIIDEEKGNNTHVNSQRTVKADISSYIGKIEILEDKYIITLIKSMEIERLLLAKHIPEPVKIQEYIACRYGKRSTDAKAQSLFNKMNPVSESQLRYLEREYTWLKINRVNENNAKQYSIFYHGQDNMYTKEGEKKKEANWGKQRAITIEIDLKKYNEEMGKQKDSNKDIVESQ